MRIAVSSSRPYADVPGFCNGSRLCENASVPRNCGTILYAGDMHAPGIAVWTHSECLSWRCPGRSREDSSLAFAFSHSLGRERSPPVKSASCIRGPEADGQKTTQPRRRLPTFVRLEADVLRAHTGSRVAAERHGTPRSVACPYANDLIVRRWKHCARPISLLQARQIFDPGKFFGMLRDAEVRGKTRRS